MNRRRLLAIASILIISTMFYIGWTNRAASIATSRAAAMVSTMNARIDSLVVAVTGTSNLQPDDKRTVVSEVSGTISKVLVKDGQTVKAGDVLATISNLDIVSQYQMAQNDLKSQRIRLNEAKTATRSQISSVESQVSTARTALQAKQDDLANLIITAPVSGRVASVSVTSGQSISRNQAVLTVVDDSQVLVVAQVPQQDSVRVSVGQTASISFGSELPSATGTVYSIGAEASQASGNKGATVPVAIRITNASGVYRTGLAANVTISPSTGDPIFVPATVSPIERHDIKAKVDGTVSAVNVRDGDSVSAGQALVSLTNDNLAADLRKADSDLELALENQAKIDRGLPPSATESSIGQQELQVQQAEITLAARAENVEALQVRAPIDGIVASHPVNAGDRVSANQQLFVIADSRAMVMTVSVDELDVTKIKPGQPAAVTVEALSGKQFTAVVTEVSTEGTVKDGVATYNVTLRLPEPAGLYSGMTATASITVAERTDVLVVPSEAVRVNGNRKTVAVMRNGSPVQVEVTVGLSNDISTEITSGLQAGDAVVVASRQTQGQNMMQNPLGGGQRVQINSGPRPSTR